MRARQTQISWMYVVLIMYIATNTPLSLLVYQYPTLPAVYQYPTLRVLSLLVYQYPTGGVHKVGVRYVVWITYKEGAYGLDYMWDFNTS